MVLGLIKFVAQFPFILLILYPSNPVSTLDQQQTSKIYKAKITNWQDVGGKDMKITVVNKAEGRSKLELLLDYFKLKNSEIKPHVIIGDNLQAIKLIAGNPYAIGYVSIGTAAYEAKRGVPTNLLPLNGKVASMTTVHCGDFSLSRPLYLITRKAPSGLVKDFISFARSEQIHDFIQA